MPTFPPLNKSSTINNEQVGFSEPKTETAAKLAHEQADSAGLRKDQNGLNRYFSNVRLILKKQSNLDPEIAGYFDAIIDQAERKTIKNT